MSKDFNWYQCKLEMCNGKTLRGIRSIAKSSLEFKRRMERTCKDILFQKGFNDKGIVKNIHVELVPESIKSKYNLNNKNDYERFLQYMDDEKDTSLEN